MSSSQGFTVNWMTLAIALALLNINVLSQPRNTAPLDLRQRLRLVRVIETPLHKYAGVYFIANGEQFVIRDHVLGVRVFDADSGRLDAAISPCSGNKFTSFPFTEAYSLFAVGCENTGVAEVWNIRGNRLVRTIQFSKVPYFRVTISQNAETLVLENPHDEPTELWHLETGTRIATLTASRTKGSRDSDTVAYSPDDRIVAVSYNADLYLWNAQKGEILFYLLDTAENLKLPGGIRAAHRNAIYHLMFSDDGRFLFSGSIDSTVKQWEVSTGKLIQTFAGHNSRISSLALSQDSRFLATGSNDKKAKLWDVETGQLLWTSSDHRGYLWKMVFSPDGKILVTMTGNANIGDSNEIRMWETATGKLLGQMPARWWQSFLSPDLRYFVTVGKKKNTIELYEFVDRVQM